MNMNRSIQASLPLLGALALSACLPVQGEGGGGDASLTYASFDARTSVGAQGLVCKVVFGCPGAEGGSTGALLGRYASESECANSDLPFITDRYFDPPLAYEQGRMRFDEEAGQRCLDAFQRERNKDACELAQGIQLDECEGVFAGAVEAGGDCLSDDECIGGAECELRTEECFGTCSPGAPCNGGYCGDGEFCDTDVDTFEDSCRPKLDVGDTCTRFSDCTATDPGAECISPPGEDEGVCVGLNSLAEGERCEFYDELCGAGLVCRDEVCTQSTFSPGPSRLPARDEPCRIGDTACVAGLACVGLDSDGNGTCSTPLGAGESCVAFWECDGNLVCKGTNGPGAPGTCELPIPVGSACTQDFECASFVCSGGVCMGDDDTCQIP